MVAGDCTCAYRLTYPVGHLQKISVYRYAVCADRHSRRYLNGWRLLHLRSCTAWILVGRSFSFQPQQLRRHRTFCPRLCPSIGYPRIIVADIILTPRQMDELAHHTILPWHQRLL